ncbi:craniofacial development protein 2-like [Metopolophium dirhodum]|uniref:craniofacial development protein 2-like n=1 Tax=Metopolophium dirhodum TaxID=44670 RepID=UPI00298FC0B5|nr:craniofacial development protein 2-like [Metopolophium dirhodum]
MPRMKNMELKDFTTGTWNVRTLYKPGNLTTAILELERYRLDIIAIQEVRWTGEGSLKIGNWTVFHSGGDEHQGGVSFIVNDKILHRVKKFKAVNDRICHMELECRWFNVILINGYAPTEDKEDEVKDIFYENLENECDRIPTNKVKILLGDFNAKIGQEVEYRPTIGKESLHRTSNDNGTRLVNFATTRNMIISSTTFPHKDIHKETWVSPSGQIKNQIDHVAVDRRFKKCVMDVRSMRGSSAMSDHFIVRAKIKLRLSVEWRKKNVSIKRFNIEDKKNQEINRQYKNKLKETLSLTENSNNVDNNVDNLWNEIENSIKTVATEVLGFEERERGKKWFDEQCKKANNERDIARIKMLKDPSEENKRVLSTRQRETKQLFRKKKRACENSRLEIIENSYNNNVRLFFEKTNEIKNGFKTKATIIKDEEGLLITDKKKAANEFRNMFETMLNQPTQVEVEENLNTVEQRLDEPTLEEVERAANMLKNRKALGEDAIVAELLKEGGKELMT